MFKNKALFLDRDGVVNVDYGYVHKKEDFHFIDGIFSLAAAALREGFLIIIVTNQAGIGRGYYTEAQFHELMDWVKDEFRRRGAALHAFYFCPCHPTHGIGSYKKESPFRKPAPGMLLQAASDYNIDLKASLMVGDSLTDMEAGRTAGIGHLFYLAPKNAVRGGPPLPGVDVAYSLSEIEARLFLCDNTPPSAEHFLKGYYNTL